MRRESKEGVKILCNQDKYFNAIFSKSTMNTKVHDEQNTGILGISYSAELQKSLRQKEKLGRWNISESFHSKELKSWQILDG